MSTTEILPSAQVVHEAQVALRELAPLGTRPTIAGVIRIKTDTGERTVTVPSQAFELFLEVLGQMANGNAVTIVPVHAELTTQQAADLLNVSRPHLVKLLGSGAIPFRRVGAHRRVAASDLFNYKKQEQVRQAKLMAELAAEGQRLGL